jgi:hypothetical protein
MIKSIFLTFLMLVTNFVSAQQKNTKFLPVSLSVSEMEVLQKEIENTAAKYDSVLHLVRGTQGKHYHSDF